MQKTMLAIVVAAAGHMEAASNGPSFTVSAIKPVDLYTYRGGAVPIQVSPSGFRCVCSLQSLIMAAFQMKRDNVVFPPDLRDADVYQISATFPETARGDFALMLQNLLHERFHLTAHRETRDAPIYVLLVAPGGLKLKRTPGPASIEDAIRNPPKSFFRGVIGPRADRLKTSGSGTLDEIASGIRIDRPVINMTGIIGRFDFSIDAVIPPRAGARTFGPPVTESSPDDPPSIFTVVKKLGLRLEPRKTQQEFLIIDRVSKLPTPN